jgi:phosphopantetheinyl transferase
MSSRDAPALSLVAACKGGCGLTPEERATCSGLPAHLRADWRAGRLAARRAAATVLGDVPASCLSIRSTAAGRPIVAIQGSPTKRPPLPVKVSISHRNGHGAAAADRSRRVGVDVEHRVELPPGARRYFLSPSEERGSGLDGVTLWALKEAAWKALGCDASTPFKDLELIFAPDLVAIRVGTSVSRAHARVMSAWSDHVVALVWIDEGDDAGEQVAS